MTTASNAWVAGVAVVLPAAGPSLAAGDFNPPGWVDTDGNGFRDNRDAHFLGPGESLVIGVNSDWDPPAYSTSYHWHWWPTDGVTYEGDHSPAAESCPLSVTTTGWAVHGSARRTRRDPT